MRLYVTVGLPRSGKTTWARTTGWPIVNPDSIRLAIHGQRFYAPAEPLVWAMAYSMVEALRLAGHARIVVDATNVSAKRRREWEIRYEGAVEWKVIETSPEECIRRARAEGDAEIIPVIERMAAEWDLPKPWLPRCPCGRNAKADGVCGECSFFPPSLEEREAAARRAPSPDAKPEETP